MKPPKSYINQTPAIRKKQKEYFKEYFNSTPAQVRALGMKHIKRFTRELCKKDYELRYLRENREAVIQHFSDKGLIVYYNKGGYRSFYYHSSQAISLNMLSAHQDVVRYKKFTEYRSFKNHPTIGSINTETWEDYYLVLLAHEFSHFVQRFACSKEKRYSLVDWQKSHGRAFKDIYAHLRREIVNPQLSNPKSEKLTSRAA